MNQKITNKGPLDYKTDVFLNDLFYMLSSYKDDVTPKDI